MSLLLRFGRQLVALTAGGVLFGAAQRSPAQDAVAPPPGRDPAFASATPTVPFTPIPVEAPLFPNRPTPADEEVATAAAADEDKDKDKDKGALDRLLGTGGAAGGGGGSKEKKWYDKLSFRGYTQFRLNETLDENPNGAPAVLVGDRSVGDSQNFFIRRARLILSGDVSDHLALYFQTDFANTPPGSTDGTFFAQLRDLYGDVYLDADKVHRFRVGLSKVPFGFENMQSSQNRLPLDRSDAINSAVARNERDLGVFYYFTPEDKQELFKHLVEGGLKGSGNYGVFGLGVYNGQGGSFVEQNNNLHAVARVTYPFTLDGGQILEFSTQAYTGKYTVLSAPIRARGRGPSVRPQNTLETSGRAGVRDERVGWTAVVYPQPFGFQAEWNVGRGPALNAAQTAVQERAVQGGYLMAMYRHETPSAGVFIPFARYEHYRGGIRSERNAPYVNVDEWNLGVEWQIRKEMELTVQYVPTHRTNTTAFDTAGVTSYRQFQGDLLRFQFQINY